jgi:ornithine cyclodeaminase/alanine dehydrogenase-like protein (mu-crystallin family)
MIPGTGEAHAPLWLSEADVEALIVPRDLVQAVKAGFLALDKGDLTEPPALRMDGLDDGAAYFTVFPAHNSTTRMASAKILAGRPGNPAEGRPEIDAVVALADTRTGRLLALISARALTAWRTAAVTALALSELSYGKLGTIGLIGTGAQARAHARMLAESGLAKTLLVASPLQGPARAEAFAAELTAINGLPVRAAAVGAMAAQCDAVVTMSLARTPLSLGTIPPDLVIVGVGPFYPDAHEIDPDLVSTAAMVISDHPERLKRQWVGSVLLDMAVIDPVAITSLLSGSVKAPTKGRRVVLSDGRGFEDNVAATLVFEAAQRAGKGLSLP